MQQLSSKSGPSVKELVGNLPEAETPTERGRRLGSESGQSKRTRSTSRTEALYMEVLLCVYVCMCL